MKCNKCGKEQSDKAVVCPYCGFRLPKEIAKEVSPERSTLIEFPSASSRNDKLPRSSNNAMPISSSTSDWRAELSAKVRQVKERRNMQEARGRLQAELEAAAHRYQQTNNLPSVAVSSPATITGISTSELESDRPANPVIEAALKRVQRASEMAVKTQTPANNLSAKPTVTSGITSKTVAQAQANQGSVATIVAEIETNLPPSSCAPSDENFSISNMLVDELDEPMPVSKVDRELMSVASSPLPSPHMPRIISAIPKSISTPTVGATAVALVLEEEELTETQLVPITEEISLPKNDQMDFLVEELQAAIETNLEMNSETNIAANMELEEPRRSVRVIKESEVGPNYLDELIAVCEQNRSLSSDAANRSQRLISAALDLLVIGVSSSVFWATSYILGINFSDERVFTTLACSSLVVGLIYLTMMVFVSARTFGMMFVGTRVINSNTKESPSMLQAFLRAVGYFVSLGLLGLGFVWMFLDREQRTLHDIVSGTFVVRDY